MDRGKAANALFRGHWFDMNSARRNLLYLSSIFAGCEGVIKYMAHEGRNVEGWDERDHPLELLFDDHCTSEISRLLIEIAVTVRMLDDMAGPHVVSIGFKVGTFNQGRCDAALTLREACNKIIHATNVEFDFGGGVTTYVAKSGEELTECISYVRPTSLQLHGERAGEPWTAELDIMLFIKAATMVTYRYDKALDELHDYYEPKRAGEE
jgi:hypothetical protein